MLAASPCDLRSELRARRGRGGAWVAGSAGCSAARRGAAAGGGREPHFLVEELDGETGLLKRFALRDGLQSGSLFLNLRHGFVSDDLDLRKGQGGRDIKDQE